MKRAGAIVLVLALMAQPATALPPLDTIVEDLTRFRAASGDVTGRGLLTYGPFQDVPVRLQRNWNEVPVLLFADTRLEADWTDPALDIVLRMVGAALSAEDLFAAVEDMGRSLEPMVQTLAFRGDELVYVVGGSLLSPAARITVSRDTYRLRALELPMPEGVYALVMSEYELAAGWFPSSVTVRRDDRVLFDLRLTELSPR